MKTLYSFIVALILSAAVFFNDVTAQVTVTGCTGSGNGIYSSLTNSSGAFSSINCGSQTGANIVISITADVANETGNYSLNAGAWTSLTINPCGIRTISGTVPGKPLINLNGADNVTINGLNTGGNSLTISNLSTASTASTSTICYVNDAVNNTITNCTILGSATGSLSTNCGNIFISTAAACGTGNDNITISNCNIGPAGCNLPSKLIYGNGSTTSSGIANSGILISNCNMYDFFLTSGCAAVYVVSGNTDWSVTSNRIYQSEKRTFSASGTMNGIYFSNSAFGDNIQINGNIIGYSNSYGTGTLILDGGGVAGKFQGIYLFALPTALNACNINSNIITDISLALTTGTFYGIYNATLSGTNTININGNQIKNIAITTTTGEVTAVYAGSAAALNCNNNTIDNISRDAAGYFCGIKYYTPTTATFNGNTISNLTSTSTTSTSGIYGIYSGNAAVNECVNGNSIYNITSGSTMAQYIYGIACGTSAGIKTVQNNNIHNISACGGATIYGIYTTYGTSIEISGNSIYSVSGGNYMHGIYQYASATTCNIYKNKIYNLSSTSTSTTMEGIFASNSVLTNIYNNIISDFTASYATSGVAIEGIYIYGGTTVNLFYNTIYFNAASTGAGFGSSCVFAFTTPTVEMRNNILVNLSAPGSSGYTAAYRRNGASLTNYSSNSNNNCFYAGIPGTRNSIMYNGSSYSTIADYKALVGPSREAVSFSENPPFMNVSSAPYDLRIQADAYTQCESGGTPVTSPISITDDFEGNLRSSQSPDVGADEGGFTPSAVWLGITSNVWNVASNWGSGTAVPSPTQNILINKTGSFNPVIDGNITMAGLYIKTTNTLTINALQTISVNGNCTNNGTISDNGGTTLLSGSSAQNIGGSGISSFNNLSISNPYGIYLTGNISVSGTLALSGSLLDLNHNNISLGTTGILAESGTSYIKQSDMIEPFGTISAIRNLNAPSGENIAGLGVSITSAAILGNTSVTRGVERKHDANGNLAIARYYDITPANNTGLNAKVVFSYDVSELGGGIQEGNLVLFKSTDNGISWIQINGALNTTNKTITVNGVNDFSLWTFGDKEAPLPVGLSSFTADVVSRNVNLKWVTVSEENNYGFEIQKRISISGTLYSGWEKVAFIHGNGTKPTSTEYFFCDTKMNTGKYNYRLKQIDVNGHAEYYLLNGDVEIGPPAMFNLGQNYPNPFNPATKIDFDLPCDCKVRICIYDMTGNEIKTFFKGISTAGFHTIQFNATDLSSGIYFYRITAKSETKEYVMTKKMVFLK